jgi:hypothetical protein
MNRRFRFFPGFLALILVLAITQVYVSASVAGARDALVGASAPALQQASGILTTAGNKPINVNEAAAMTGATILSGATIETPNQITATINIPGHGLLEMAADTKVIVTFDENGNIKVMLVRGCVVLHTDKGTTGEIDDSKGVAGKTNSAIDDLLDPCHSVKTAGAAAGGGGLGTRGAIAIATGVGIGVTGLAFAIRGSNPSPTVP